MEKLDDISVLNERAFSVLTENELQVRFKDIYRRINDEHEYDESDI